MRLYVLFTSLFVIFISYYPTLYHWQHTPPGRVWSGTTFYSDDYAVYLHTIHQGVAGRWTVVDKFTGEPHQGSLLHIYYLLAGKILATLANSTFYILNFTFRLNLQPALSPAEGSIYTYHFLRLLATISALAAAWFFVKTLLKNSTQRFVAWTLVCFSGLLPGKLISPNFNFWNPLLLEPDISTRFATQSHHTFGSAFMLLSLTLFLLYVRGERKLNIPFARPERSRRVNYQLSIIILSIAVSFLNSWIEPNTSFATILVLLTANISMFLLNQFKKTNYQLSTTRPERSRRVNYQLIGVIVAAAPALLYFRLLNRTEPWKTLFIFDTSQHFNLTKEHVVSSLGIPLLISLLFPLLFLLRKKFTQYLDKLSILMIFSWSIIFITLYIFAPVLHINRLRFYHQPIFVVLAIISSIVVTTLLRLFPKTYSLIPILTLAIILPSIPASYTTLRERIHEYDSHTILVYPSQDQKALFDWMDKNIENEKVVLTLYEAGNLIPIWSNQRVFAGNVSETLNYEKKSKQALEFYQGKMSVESAHKFLKENYIDYVYLGYQENLGLNPLYYPYLEQVHYNPAAYIFKVN